MMNAPTVAEKRPASKPVRVIETNGGTDRLTTYEHQNTICILFPSICNPRILLFDFGQIHIPHLVLGVFLGCREGVNVVMQYVAFLNAPPSLCVPPWTDVCRLLRGMGGA